MARLLRLAAAAAAALLTAAGARAQPAAASGVGRFELTAAWWRPGQAIVLASDVPGVLGSSIDFARDLGFADRGLPDVQLVVKAAAKHRLRFEYIPIRYTAAAAPARALVFDGATYPAGAPIATTFDWKAWRIGYEYDFLVRRRVTAGVIVEGRQTDITVRLAGASADHSVRTQIPIPAAGGTIRLQAARRLSLSSEVDFFEVPDNAQKSYGGRYADVDLSATVSLARRLAARGGFRSIAIRHLGATDSGTLTLNGIYLGAVVGF